MVENLNKIKTFLLCLVFVQEGSSNHFKYLSLVWVNKTNIMKSNCKNFEKI